MPVRRPTVNRKLPAKQSLRGRFWSWTGDQPWWLRWFWRTAAAGMVLGLFLWLVFEIYFGSLARGYDLDSLGTMPERSEVMDRDGKIIGRMYGENRVLVQKAQVANYFIQALLVREDERFYSHGGIDWFGIVRAAMRNLKAGRTVQGASTISMQLARNSFGLMDQKTLHRKLLEMALTQRIERAKTKDEILELYVNRIFFGNGIYGIERAAQVYFGKHASELRLDEAALLAGIIRGPNKFSPFRNYKGALAERDTVLDRMVVKEYLTPEQANEAKAQPTPVLPPPRNTQQESYALDAVRHDLEQVLDIQDMEDGSLKIYTTLDSKLQQASEEALERKLSSLEQQSGYQHQTMAQYHRARARGADAKPEYVQGAVLLLENHTGAIRAVVGGRDYDDSTYNRALMAKRQVGSTFKPIVYATAIEKAGLLPSTLINDDPIGPRELRSGAGNWSPKNSDGTFNGMQSLEFGLVKSRNTMTVRIGERAGMDRVLDMAEQAGIKDIAGRNPQIYIGNLGATVKAMTSAFSMFPNGGQRCRPYLIDRIENAAGEVLFRSGQIQYEVVSPGTAYLMTNMLQKVTGPGGTAAAARQAGLKTPIGGKTGTTDDYQDAWFIGFNPDFTCGVWVGLDDPEKIVGQGYGGKISLPIWTEVMKAVEARTPSLMKATFPQPNLTPAVICADSGALAGSNCPHPQHVNLPLSRVPTGYCQEHNGGPAIQKSPEPEERSLWQRLKGIFQ